MEKFLIVFGVVMLSIALTLGWVWLVTLSVNYVLVALGCKPVGMILVWACMALLSIVGGYFKSTVKG